MYCYEETLMTRILETLTIVVASLLPLCSVIMLYFAASGALRLALTVVASAFFSLALAIMTNARKIEVFAATSAYVSPSFRQN
jgi:hypothetical protein